MPNPPSLPLSRLLADLPEAVVHGDTDVMVSHITHDSRQARPGSLFVAYRGVNQDVHRFIPHALARGATAVLIERPFAEIKTELDLPAGATFVEVPDARQARADLAAALYGHPSRELAVVGVTGTDGKTTTSTLIQAMLLAAGRRVGLISTVAAMIGAESMDTGLHVTTPEAEDVQALLRRMVDAGMDAAVLEVTSHGLAQHRVRGVDFDVAVVTNVTHEALEYHGTFEAYRAAKATLFEGLTKSRPKPGVTKTAVLNADDPSFEFFRQIQVPRQLVYALEEMKVVKEAATGLDEIPTAAPSTASNDPSIDFLASQVHYSPAGLRFSAATPAGTVDIASPFIGRYNAANLLAAMAASSVLGAGPDAWRAGAAAVTGIPGRMELIQAGQPFAAVVDFAHTPNALFHALTAARLLADPVAGRVIAVFGAAGLRDPSKRPLMGQAAARTAEVAVLTAEDPRTEDLADILSALASGLAGEGKREGVDFFKEPDRGAAIRLACAMAGPGDVVVVCGKGHEQSMCFGEHEYPWDDRLALRAALLGESYGGLPTGSS